MWNVTRMGMEAIERNLEKVFNITPQDLFQNIPLRVRLPRGILWFPMHTEGRIVNINCQDVMNKKEP